MTFRAFILLSCMLVVPGMAMFSHRLPEDVRASLRQHVWNPAHTAWQTLARKAGLVGPELPPDESPFIAAERPPAPMATAATPPRQPARPPEPAPAATETTPARVVMPVVTLAPANAIVPPVAPQGNGLAVPIATSRAAGRSFTQAPPRRGPQAAAPGVAMPPQPPADPPVLPIRDEPPRATAPEPPTADGAAPQTARLDAGDTRERLEALGAFAVDAQPLSGVAAGYAASCRLAVDPKGELHRMFHATGPDAAAAMRSLVEQVEAWQRERSTPPAARL